MILPILATSNLESSIDFYTTKLGFNELFRMNGPDGTVVFAMVGIGNASIGLSAQDAPAPKGNGVVFMVYVADETDIDAYYAEVKGRGVPMKEDITDQYWGDRSFSVIDPDGYYIQLSKTTRQVTPEELQGNATG